MRSRATLVPFLPVILASALQAQQTTATFYAMVADSSGGSIPSATVTLTHDDTGSVSVKTTTPESEAVFDFLRVGSYTVGIEAKGFKRLESKGIELSAAQNVRQTFVMEIGATGETVSVDAS